MAAMSLFDFSTQKLGSAHRCSVSAGKSEIVQTAKNSFKRMQTLKLLLVPVQSDIGNICSYHRRPVAYGEIIIFTGSHNNSPMFTTATVRHKKAGFSRTVVPRVPFQAGAAKF